MQEIVLTVFEGDPEWIDTNGVGGYASSTVTGKNTRRYHGLLVVPSKGSLSRSVLISRLDETIITGEQNYELAVRAYRELTVPNGSHYLNSFHYGIVPEWRYQIDDAVFFRKSILMIPGEGTVLFRYSIDECPHSCCLRLEPFLVNRNFHSLKTSSYSVIDRQDWNGKRLFISPSGDLTPYSLVVPHSEFHSEPDWYYKLFYSKEAERGQGADEDLYRIGWFHLPIESGGTYFACATIEPKRWEDSRAYPILWEQEIARRQKNQIANSSSSLLKKSLLNASSTFLIQRHDAQQSDRFRQSIVAGYHWFTDWGRDAMIALPGLCLIPGKLDLAKAILKTFAESIQDGLVPNRFTDIDGEAEYNSIDASLWFIVNGYRCVKEINDPQFLQRVFLPAVSDILSACKAGTRFSVKQQDDFLLSAGDGKDQLTWMDARVGDWVVTPRHGKAVEVNALWCNAFFCLAELVNDVTDRDRLQSEGRRIQESFSSSFWNEDEGCLFDVVDDAGKDSSIRPNQVIPLSLPFELLSKEQSVKVLEVVHRELLTPRGLRTLSPKDPRYCGKYFGTVLERDGAYHQGTVWPWLLGPYARAVARYGSRERRVETLQLLKGFESHLFEHGIGTVSEIFDGDSPHRPRGCISQAWSVAELLCAIDVLEG
ncbi:MAG: glycogen debranching enzyme family protein [Bdellovibrionales bacterium]|nr:glycogen debranching enzyme family protein [Bdellovibrionales bacterium]